MASVPGIFIDAKLKSIYEELKARLAEAKLSGEVKRIVMTHEPLLRAGEFKLNRRKIAERVDLGQMRVFDPHKIDEHVAELVSGMEAELAACFAEALGKDSSEIGVEDDFFSDLNGTSLDYFALLGLIKSRLGIDIISNGEVKLSTVKAIAEYATK